MKVFLSDNIINKVESEAKAIVKNNPTTIDNKHPLIRLLIAEYITKGTEYIQKEYNLQKAPARKIASYAVRNLVEAQLPY